MKFIDVHTHGGFGINFSKCTINDVQEFANRALKYSTLAFLPTLATDYVENVQEQLKIFSEFAKIQTRGAKMLGVHLEGIFLNPIKAGIHDHSLFLLPTVKNFKYVAGNFLNIIKTVTLAPELDKDLKLTNFLHEKGIKVQAGHTLAKTDQGMDSTTHHFNAMPNLSHRGASITLKALFNDEIYTEIVADGIHVSDDMLKLFFRVKNRDKIIIISDSLPLAYSNLKKIEFCNQLIFNSSEGARNADGTLAGSILFIRDIAGRLIENGILTQSDVQKMTWDNPIKYLGLSESTVESILKLGKNNE